ncbi:MAG: penicillin-binding protein 2 [Rhodobiaceae bacterium]|nr:penicillin-binding protein 2 [Rhodobiaceae bacterium]|tara:strand:- start:9163 stop:11028 length:1866 start_codon:yes stop_codon:yes gene_type:complete
MRKTLLFVIVITASAVFILRLFYLQVYNTEPYSIYEDNAIRKVFTYPKRGYIFDRNNNLLVSNQPSYDVMIIPGLVKKLDTLEFCKLLKISKTYFDNKIERTSRYSRRTPSVFLAHLSKEDYGFLAEKIRKFEGFYIQKRNLRQYNTKIGANVLGYVAEVNRSNLEKDNYYSQGDIIGKQGVELSYEKFLRGEKGIKFIQKDRFNRDIGSYNDGSNDQNSIPGSDLTITIDSELQQYGELLMSNKKGAIVAIEPGSGELLTLVSAPSYNPNLLVGRHRSKNYFKLYNDSIYKPLVDKGLLSTFPAGSPFKIVVGLIALKENIINEKTTILCNGQYIYGKNKKSMKCHCGGGYRNIYNAISESCNSYFADTYRKNISQNNKISENFDIWSENIKSFGFGNYLNNDLPIGKKGMIPTSEFYDKWYPDFRWGPTTNLSNSIGQGEILVTPIQLANMIAAVANKGFYYTPHIIKKIEGISIPDRFTEKNRINIEKEYFDIVEKGLSKVYESGTGKFLNIPGIEMCGKSGTAENFTKINGKKTQLTDHSIFVAYAPKNDPKIAIAVLVENGYYGSTWAGRISSLMIEKYLKGRISDNRVEKLVINKSLESEYKKPFSNKPFKINKQ